MLLSSDRFFTWFGLSHAEAIFPLMTFVEKLFLFLFSPFEAFPKLSPRVTSQRAFFRDAVLPFPSCSDNNLPPDDLKPLFSNRLSAHPPSHPLPTLFENGDDPLIQRASPPLARVLPYHRKRGVPFFLQRTLFRLLFSRLSHSFNIRRLRPFHCVVAFDTPLPRGPGSLTL